MRALIHINLVIVCLLFCSQTSFGEEPEKEKSLGETAFSLLFPGAYFIGKHLDKKLKKESIKVKEIKYDLDLQSEVVKRSPIYSPPKGLPKKDIQRRTFIRSETLEISKSLEAELGLEIKVINLSVRGKLEQVNSSTFAQEDTVTKEVEIVGDGVSKYRFVYSDLYRTGIAVFEKKTKDGVVIKEVPFKHKDGFDITIEKVE